MYVQGQQKLNVMLHMWRVMLATYVLIPHAFDRIIQGLIILDCLKFHSFLLIFPLSFWVILTQRQKIVSLSLEQTNLFTHGTLVVTA